ncbi:MAG: alkaline phosphatase D family protein [Planctomycetaceae bacterium]|nr:alkaline phosphatase D family protein [Planctomycetaceae bacterium]
MTSFTRRVALKVMGLGTAYLGWPARKLQTADADLLARVDTNPLVGDWSQTHDRVWLGAQFWANPMENWRVIDGAAECQSMEGGRNVHLITHQLEQADQPFEMSVRVSQVESKEVDAGVGFRVGVQSDLNEYRSNSFSGRGINAGIANGQLVLAGKRRDISGKVDLDDFIIQLQGTPKGEQYELTVEVKQAGGKTIDSMTQTVKKEAVLGNVAIANNFNSPNRRGQTPAQRKQGARYRFRDWKVSGPAFTIRPERAFGPILWSMYSLSDSRSDDGFVMKISALTGPLGEKDNQSVELFVQKEGEWKSLGTANLETDAWVATFRIPNWNEKIDTPYKLVYVEKGKDGSEAPGEWTGTIKANPSDRPLRLGALTCQNDYGFPYEPVANNLVKLDPDMLYFSGDQIYENHGGFGIIREPAEPAILNYLRKYYQFGWAFREAMKDRPTLVIPDDHDVFQGNIWGEGGAKMKDLDGGASSKGGYREPARMVNAVHKTCVSHHPDFADPTPVKQDISVYYGDMVYGGVSFAVIADRQWKSGPERVETGSGRADHVLDKNFDTSVLDKPGLVLLGERQEEWLKKWSRDWRGHSMKVLLSQTVFAGVATHHGGYNGYLKADLDSGGWPQTARNNAIDCVRESKALHINGDQHLATLSQYGVDDQRDSNWAFCTPAISAGYPRWWRPDDLGMEHQNRPSHNLPNTGEFIDGLGNKVYVYAVGNPIVPKGKNRYETAHQKGSGFGLVTIDTEKKTYHLDAFRFLVDPNDGNPENQFPGWPVTIQQKENAGDNVIG